MRLRHTSYVTFHTIRVRTYTKSYLCISSNFYSIINQNRGSLNAMKATLVLGVFEEREAGELLGKRLYSAFLKEEERCM